MDRLPDRHDDEAEVCFPDRPLLDEDAGPLVRPFQMTGGRAAPAKDLDLITLVLATAAPSHDHDAEAAEILRLSASVISIAELSAHMKVPAMVVKVLVSDLLVAQKVTLTTPELKADRDILEALLAGLQRRL